MSAAFQIPTASQYCVFAAAKSSRCHATETAFDFSCAVIESALQAFIRLSYFPWAGINFAASIIPPLGCIEKQVPESIQLIRETCFIAADLIVFGVTWRHATYRNFQRLRRQNESSPTYTAILFRDAFSSADADSAHTFQTINLVTFFSDPITSILVSRFLLNLQEVHRYRADHLQLSCLSESVGQGSLQHFATKVIGSLGESLPPPGDTSLEDEPLAVEGASEDTVTA
ncbi:hypothetical protein L227DRAFT_567749 [Lentinus tigrinus ALCF2SS1-6]|uniref:Uncharacterized protein n=1 Tax=Lentinus tigrinus ALCF2SS1-6 TaxID=1328759 RepID=A0A5C2RTC0_9APHY|nr:hypothetical protein L227DRAFT_567749 [Lentinus tigrinus ALCF2SS1-6]